MHKKFNSWVEMSHSLVGLNLIDQVVPIFLNELTHELFCDYPAASALPDPECFVLLVIPVLVLLNPLIHSVYDLLISLGISPRMASPYVRVWQQEFVLL